MLGPIDYIAVSFRGNNFDGSILKEIKKVTDSGVIRVVDLVLAIKDENGEIAVAEIEDQDEDLKEVAKMLGHKGDMPLLTEDDIDKLGDSMDNDTTAALLVIEQLWAKDFKKAMLDKGGELIDEGRIHADKVTAAMEEMETAK